MHTRSNKILNKTSEAPKSRGPHKKRVHDFEICEIKDFPLKNKDILSHMFFLREQSITNKEPKRKTSDLVKLVILTIQNLQPPNILSRRQLEIHINEVFEKYTLFMKHPDRKIDERKNFLEKNFYATKKYPNESDSIDEESENNIEELEDQVEECNNNQDLSYNDSFSESVSQSFSNPSKSTSTPFKSISTTVQNKSFEYATSETTPELTESVVDKRNLTDISVVCELALRYGANYSLTAAISSGALAAHKIVTPNVRTEIIDRQKVQRQTDHLIKEAKCVGFKKFANLNNVYFDSKKIDGKTENNTISKQNMYVFVEGITGKFIFSEISTGEDAAASVQMIKDSFTRRELELSKIYLIGVDGTNVNTGHKNGIIRQLEVSKFFF